MTKCVNRSVVLGLLSLFLSPNCFQHFQAKEIPIRVIIDLDGMDSVSILPNEVIEQCSSIIDMKGQTPPEELERAYAARARAYLTLKNFPAAKADFDELIRLRPTDTKSKCFRAMVFNSLGNKEEALGELRKVLEESPDTSLAYVAMAMVLAENKDRNLAIASATRAISLDPKNPLGYMTRATLYFSQFEAQHCLEDTTHIVEKWPCSGLSDPEYVYIMRGTALLWLERPQEALPNFLMARKLNPSSANAVWGIWRVYRDTERWHMAYRLAQECNRLNPNNPERYCALAEACAHTDRLEEAKQMLEKATTIENNDSGIFARIAEMYFLIGNYSDSTKYYDKALTLNPKLSSALMGKAILLASCPEKKMRNGRQALELAYRAHRECNLPSWMFWQSTMTIAIAQAECSDFQEATRLAKHSLELLGADSGSRETYQNYLRLFEKKLPYRHRPSGQK